MIWTSVRQDSNCIDKVLINDNFLMRLFFSQWPSTSEYCQTFSNHSEQLDWWAVTGLFDSNFELGFMHWADKYKRHVSKKILQNWYHPPASRLIIRYWFLLHWKTDNNDSYFIKLHHLFITFSTGCLSHIWNVISINILIMRHSTWVELTLLWVVTMTSNKIDFLLLLINMQHQ